jgi:hypothetical protein
MGMAKSKVPSCQMKGILVGISAPSPFLISLLVVVCSFSFSCLESGDSALRNSPLDDHPSPTSEPLVIDDQESVPVQVDLSRSPAVPLTVCGYVMHLNQEASACCWPAQELVEHEGAKWCAGVPECPWFLKEANAECHLSASMQRNLETRCDQEDARACLALGQAHRDDLSVQSNDLEAMGALQRACELGEPRACVEEVRLRLASGVRPKTGPNWVFRNQLPWCDRGDYSLCAEFYEGLLAARDSTSHQFSRFTENLKEVCRSSGEGCVDLALLYDHQGLSQKRQSALNRACSAGRTRACERAEGRAENAADAPVDQ